MKTVLKYDRSYKFSITVFFILSLVSLLATVYVGEMLLPLCAAFFAVLLVFEREKRILSLLCVLISVILLFLPISITPIWGVASLLCGLVLFLLYRFEFAKCDTAFIITLLIATFVIISFVLIAFSITGEYSFDAVVNFYTELYKFIRESFVSGMSQVNIALPEGATGIEVTEEMVISIFDNTFNLLVSFLVIFSFVLSGITLKIFSAIIKIFADEGCGINEWRFSLPSIYAYLYIVLFFLSAFTIGNGVIEISILNLSGIFATVFAYVGFKAIIKNFANKNRKAIGVFLIILALIFLGNFAVDIISIYGVLQTIQQNKLSKSGQS